MADETKPNDPPKNETPPSDKPPTQRRAPSSKSRSRKSSGTHKYFKSITGKATSTQANRTVLIGVGGAASVVLLARVAGTPGVKGLNDPGDLIKIAIGSGASIIALMIMAEIAPDLVVGFSWLILIAALLSYGVDLASAVTKGTLNPGKPPTKGK